jgi:hypothetical protein
MLEIAASADKTRRVITEMNLKVRPRAVCRRRAQLIRMLVYSRNPQSGNFESDLLTYDAGALRAS